MFCSGSSPLPDVSSSARRLIQSRKTPAGQVTCVLHTCVHMPALKKALWVTKSTDSGKHIRKCNCSTGCRSARRSRGKASRPTETRGILLCGRVDLGARPCFNDQPSGMYEALATTAAAAAAATAELKSQDSGTHSGRMQPCRAGTR
jgi:hypothetical protein